MTCIPHVYLIVHGDVSGNSTFLYTQSKTDPWPPSYHDTQSGLFDDLGDAGVGRWDAVLLYTASSGDKGVGECGGSV